MNEIHPTAVIAGDVLIGDGNYIGPFAVITGPTSIGDGNWIGTGVVIGAPPEIRSFEHPRAEGVASTPAGVAIGSRNVIREYAQVHQGHSATTTIGDDGFIMNQVYVAHDGRVGDRVTLASSVLLAGSRDRGGRREPRHGRDGASIQDSRRRRDGRHEFGRDSRHPTVRSRLRLAGTGPRGQPRRSAARRRHRFRCRGLRQLVRER